MFSFSSQRSAQTQSASNPYLQYQAPTTTTQDIKGIARFYINHKLQSATSQDSIGQDMAQESKRLKDRFPEYLFHLFDGLAQKGLRHLHDGHKHLLNFLLIRNDDLSSGFKSMQASCRPFQDTLTGDDIISLRPVIDAVRDPDQRPPAALQCFTEDDLASIFGSATDDGPLNLDTQIYLVFFCQDRLERRPDLLNTILGALNSPGSNAAEAWLLKHITREEPSFKRDLKATSKTIYCRGVESLIKSIADGNSEDVHNTKIENLMALISTDASLKGDLIHGLQHTSLAPRPVADLGDLLANIQLDAPDLSPEQLKLNTAFAEIVIEAIETDTHGSLTDKLNCFFKLEDGSSSLSTPIFQASERLFKSLTPQPQAQLDLDTLTASYRTALDTVDPTTLAALIIKRALNTVHQEAIDADKGALRPDQTAPSSDPTSQLPLAKAFTATDPCLALDYKTGDRQANCNMPLNEALFMFCKFGKDQTAYRDKAGEVNQLLLANGLTDDLGFPTQDLVAFAREHLYNDYPDNPTPKDALDQLNTLITNYNGYSRTSSYSLPAQADAAPLRNAIANFHAKLVDKSASKTSGYYDTPRTQIRLLSGIVHLMNQTIVRQDVKHSVVKETATSEKTRDDYNELTAQFPHSHCLPEKTFIYDQALAILKEVHTEGTEAYTDAKACLDARYKDDLPTFKNDLLVGHTEPAQHRLRQRLNFDPKTASLPTRLAYLDTRLAYLDAARPLTTGFLRGDQESTMVKALVQGSAFPHNDDTNPEVQALLAIFETKLAEAIRVGDMPFIDRTHALLTKAVRTAGFDKTVPNSYPARLISRLLSPVGAGDSANYLHLAPLLMKAPPPSVATTPITDLDTEADRGSKTLTDPLDNVLTFRADGKSLTLNGQTYTIDDISNPSASFSEYVRSSKDAFNTFTTETMPIATRHIEVDGGQRITVRYNKDRLQGIDFIPNDPAAAPSSKTCFSPLLAAIQGTGIQVAEANETLTHARVQLRNLNFDRSMALLDKFYRVKDFCEERVQPLLKDANAHFQTAIPNQFRLIKDLNGGSEAFNKAVHKVDQGWHHYLAATYPLLSAPISAPFALANPDTIAAFIQTLETEHDLSEGSRTVLTRVSTLFNHQLGSVHDQSPVDPVVENLLVKDYLALSKIPLSPSLKRLVTEPVARRSPEATGFHFALIAWENEITDVGHIQWDTFLHAMAFDLKHRTTIPEDAKHGLGIVEKMTDIQEVDESSKTMRATYAEAKASSSSVEAHTPLTFVQIQSGQAPEEQAENLALVQTVYAEIQHLREILKHDYVQPGPVTKELFDCYDFLLKHNLVAQDYRFYDDFNKAVKSVLDSLAFDNKSDTTETLDRKVYRAIETCFGKLANEAVKTVYQDHVLVALDNRPFLRDMATILEQGSIEDADLASGEALTERARTYNADRDHQEARFQEEVKGAWEKRPEERTDEDLETMVNTQLKTLYPVQRRLELRRPFSETVSPLISDLESEEPLHTVSTFSEAVKRSQEELYDLMAAYRSKIDGELDSMRIDEERTRYQSTFSSFGSSVHKSRKDGHESKDGGWSSSGWGASKSGKKGGWGSSSGWGGY